MAQHLQADLSKGALRRARPGMPKADEGGLAGRLSRLVLMGIAGVITLAGFFLIATMHAVIMLDSTAVQIEKERAAVALAAVTRTGVAMDSVVADRLGQDFTFRDMHLSTPDDVQPHEVALPLEESDLVLAWHPRRLASETFSIVAPYRFAAGVLLLAALLVVLVKLYLIARNLETRRKAARDLAGRDPLTGLLNRRGLTEALEQSFAAEGEVALFYLDLDDFKSVNDRFGHATGDRLLECVAQRLQHAAGPDDAVARLGGDEFVILRRGAATEEQLSDFARLVHTRTTGPYGLGHVEVRVGLSIGIATRGPGAPTPADLVATADAALYRAKAVEGTPYALADTQPDISQAA